MIAADVSRHPAMIGNCPTLPFSWHPYLRIKVDMSRHDGAEEPVTMNCIAGVNYTRIYHTTYE